MSYQETVNDLAADAEQLEEVYQTALKAGETKAFKEAIDAHHESAPENLLFAAWFYRLKYNAGQAKSYMGHPANFLLCVRHSIPTSTSSFATQEVSEATDRFDDDLAVGRAETPAQPRNVCLDRV